MTKRPANSKLSKKINRINILKTLYYEETVSRQQLAKITGLTGAAVTIITRELIDLGYIYEIGQGISQGGRRPIQLKFNQDAAYVLGIDISVDETVIGISNLKNMPTEYIRVKLDLSSPDKGVKSLINVLRKIICENKAKSKGIVSLGISFPGLIQQNTGKILTAVNFSAAWEGYSLKSSIENVLKLPVHIENNAHAAVLGERWFGSGQEYKNLVYINIGYGISAGIIIEDQIVQGAKGHAGEIGHLVVEEHGPKCKCGNKGCLEAICGITALKMRLSNMLNLPKIIEDDEFFKVVRENSSEGLVIMRDVGRHIGLVTAYIINLYNPDVVFIGGKTAQAAPIFMDVLLDTVKRHALPKLVDETQILVSCLNGKAGWIGACALAVRESLFSPDSPLYKE